MSEQEYEPRIVWSRRLFSLPEEDECERLEDALQRPGASFWEDAASLRRYIELTGLSQSACAKKFGRSQAAVANRLRLLKLPAPVIEKLRASGLSERHARALLRLCDESAQLAAVETILRGKLTVAETEDYVEKCMSCRSSPDAPFAPLLAELEKLRAGMPGIEFSLAETEEDILFSVRIPKKYDKEL